MCQSIRIHLYQLINFAIILIAIAFNQVKKPQVSLMNSLSPHQTALSWWVEVFTSVSQRTYYLGPFKSREEARISRSAHVNALYYQSTEDIVALIKQH
jgi:hypothetical protein